MRCVLVFAPCSSVWAASRRYRCATPAARLRLASPASHSTGTPQPPPPLVLGVCPHSVFPACSCTRPRYTSPDSPPTPPAPHAPSREKYRTIIQDLRLYCPYKTSHPLYIIFSRTLVAPVSIAAWIFCAGRCAPIKYTALLYRGFTS